MNTVNPEEGVEVAIFYMQNIQSIIVIAISLYIEVVK